MSKSLSELVDDVSRIEQMLVESSGEITEEISALLSQVDVSLPDKIDNYAWRIDRLRMTARFYDERAQAMKKISNQIEAAIELMRDSLAVAMARLDTDVLPGNEVTFRLQRAPPSVVIEDEALIGGQYLITETITKVDKRHIAAHLKEGIEVKGARLERQKVLRTYVGGSRSLKPQE